MNINYIKHLEAVTLRMADDSRLNTSHVSMYLALFLLWNHNRFNNPLSINRSEVMKISKIGARATYHKCITELHQWGYLKYDPSHNPLKGSLIYLFNFGTTTEQVLSQQEEQLSRLAEGPSLNNTNKKKELKQVKLDSGKSKFSPPLLQEVKEFFQLNSSTETEGENFFNYFESNGWLVGGKAKMKDWNAAARNWIKRSAIFKAPSKANDRLSTVNNKDYSMPL